MTRTEGDVAAANASLPLVSIVVVNFNHAAFLADAVGSVMAQTYGAIECIVVDDASTDASADVIAGLRCRFPSLKSILLPVNGGALRASLEGFAASRGELIHFLDADDLVLPTFIEVHVGAHLSIRDAVGFTASDMVISMKGAAVSCAHANVLRYRADPACRPAARRCLPAHLAAGLPHFGCDIEILKVDPWLSDWPWVATSANVYKRHALALFVEAAGLEKIRSSTDTFFCMGVNVLAGSAIIDAPLAIWRIHGKNDHVLTPPLGHLVNFDKAKERRKQAATIDVLIAHVMTSARSLADRLWEAYEVLDIVDRLRRLHPAPPSRWSLVRAHGSELFSVLGWPRVLRWLARRG